MKTKIILVTLIGSFIVRMGYRLEGNELTLNICK